MSDNSQELLQRRENVMPRGIPRIHDLAVARAAGSKVVDMDGKEYLDLATGIGVMGVGHCNPRVVQAVREQVGKLQHTCIHVATYEPYVALCERLSARFPHGDATKVLLVNSGAEAVENSIKIARQATGKPGVLCFTESFHGRTYMGMSLTSKVGYKLGCGPFVPDVHRLTYPNYFQYGDGLSPDDFVSRELRRLEGAMANLVGPDSLGAVILEVVQGEGGFVPCPPAYLQGLRKFCDERGILLVCDEVQTGFGRTGRWAAYEHAGITPDLSVWAKAMGGGLPIAAVIGRAEVMDAAQPGTIGGTYGGNPVACASALATLDLLEEMDAPARAQALGERIHRGLTDLAKECPLIGDVRGLGAMRAMELVHDGDPQRPARVVVAKALQLCLQRGLLVLAAGTSGNVIRLLPPLTISDAEIDEALDILRRSVLDAAKEIAA